MSILRALLVVPLLGWATGWQEPPLVPTPTGIDATGRDDVTVELQSLIDRTPDGGVVRLDDDGSYRVEGTLRITERHGLTLAGNGARLFATTTGDLERAHLAIIGGAGIVIHDLEISGANPYAGLDDRAYQEEVVGQHGIRIEGATDVELARVHVLDVYGDFVYLGRHDDLRWSERVWIHDSLFERSGRQGIAITAGRDVVIERNTITDTRRATIDLEPNSPSWGVQNVHILDNQVGPGRLLFVAAAGRGPVSGIVIARNRLEGHILNMIAAPPDGERRSSYYVLDNTSDQLATRSPLSFSGIDGLVVRGNRQAVVRPGEALVSANDVCGRIVEDNDPSPGTLELAGGAPDCGPSPAIEPPGPPAAAGRPVSAAGPPAVTTTIARPATPPPSVASPQPPDNDEGTSGLGLLLRLGGLSAGSLLLWFVVQRWLRKDSSRSA